MLVRHCVNCDHVFPDPRGHVSELIVCPSCKCDADTDCGVDVVSMERSKIHSVPIEDGYSIELYVDDA